MTAVVIPLFIISALIVLNGVFVAAEFAIVTAPRTRITQLAEEGSSTAQMVLRVLNDPDLQNRYITTAQVGITIVSLALGMYGEHIVADWLELLLHGLGNLAEPLSHTIATIFAVALLTYLHVVIGEMIPKSLALQSAEPTALGLSRPMAILEYLLLPAVLVFNAVGNWIVRGLGIPPVDLKSRLVTSDELEYIVEESFEGGLIEASEQLFIENILDLQERTVEQVMTPRPKVAGIPINAEEGTVMNVICETRKSRYPLFDESIDQIIGVLHIKDLSRYRLHQSEKIILHELARPGIFVPESLTLEKMLVRFQRERFPFAIVVDEFGGTAGIVTLEDIVEEVVGEIQDEFDQEISPIEEISSGKLRVRGDLLLDELNQLYGLDLEHPESYTVGGFVMTLLGRIPRPGDRVRFKKVTFEVESVDHLAVNSVLVHLPMESLHS